MLSIIVAGRLTKDAVLRFTADSKPVLNFTVATDVGFGDRKHGVFIDCSLWGKRAEALDPYLKKGKQVTCIGGGDLRTWESNGKSGSNITCNIQEVTMQGGGEAPNDTSSPQGFRDKPAPQAQDTGFDDDDIPF